MGARFTLILVVVMAAGLSGCFESQRDETFEDTVVLDDVDVRVLNAMSDAPELTLDVDDKARLEALAYGEAGEFSLPANQYRFRVRGDTGKAELATLLDGAQDNLEEEQRYDLVLAGLLGDDSGQVVLFGEDDERFDGETQEERDEENEDLSESEKKTGPLEQVRVRAAHVTAGAGPVDVYLDDGPGQSIGGDREPDTTLAFGERSAPLLVEEDVYRLRLTEAGNAGNVVYDSGARLDFEFEDDLLLAAVPNTGIDNASYPVSLAVVDGTDATVFRDNDQQGGLQFVHAAGGEASVDVAVNGTATWSSVPFAGVEPGSGPSGYSLESAADYDITVDDSGDSLLLVENTYTETNRDLLVLNNDDRSVMTNARVRVAHAANATPQKVDIYRVETGASLSSEGTVQDPLVEGLGYLHASGYLAVPESTDHELVVTPAGTPGTELLRASITLEKGGNYRLVVAGDGNTDDVQLIRLGGVR